jgi:prevent-host-death family protein
MTNLNQRRTVTAAEAKAKFADSLRIVEKGDVVVITRYGKPVAALVNADELEQLERLRSKSPAEGLAKLVGRWSDSEELATELDRIERTGSETQPLPEID